MLGGLFPDDRSISSSEKISNFYLPNKDEFDKSIGLDFTNRWCTKRAYNDEVIILAQFCELVGPIPLLVVPHHTYMGSRMIDMVVLKAMSADYQSCDDGDTPITGSTDVLDADCVVPFFAHYFTLMDVYGRGYVRPCCIIVCCRDRVRASHLFDAGRGIVRRNLETFTSNNLDHFQKELRCNLALISQMQRSEGGKSCVDMTNLTNKEFELLREEYTELLDKIEQITGELDEQDSLEQSDKELFLSSLQGNARRRDPRSIFKIMRCHENEVTNALQIITETLKRTVTPRMFLLHEPCDSEPCEALDDSINTGSLSKYNMRYFHSAVTCDRIVHVISKFSSICCCRKSIDEHGRLSDASELDSSYMFPRLLSVQGNQCQFVNNVCQSLSMPIVMRLLACIFQQCHLVVLVDSKTHLHLMMLLSLFLPKEEQTRHVPTMTTWPTMEQLVDCPVTQMRLDSRTPSVPDNIKKFAAVYDASANKFLCGPDYNKGHLATFLDLFKTLTYKECHLGTLVNILLLSYFELVYQWISLLGRKDRRWVNKHIVEAGTSAEDTLIGERLALLVLQKLAACHQAEMGREPNLFLTSPTIFSWQCPRPSKEK